MTAEVSLDGAELPSSLPPPRDAASPATARGDASAQPITLALPDDAAQRVALLTGGAPGASGDPIPRDDAVPRTVVPRGEDAGCGVPVPGTPAGGLRGPRETWHELLAALRALVEFHDAVLDDPRDAPPTEDGAADGWRVLLGHAPGQPHPPRMPGAAHLLHLLPAGPGAPLCIRLQRHPADPFTAADAARLARAAPLLRMAVQAAAGAAGLGAIAHQASRVSDALLGVLDKLGLGLCLLDAELRAVMVSGRALRGGAIRLRRDAVALPDRSAELRLRAAVAAALAPREVGVQGLNIGSAAEPLYALVTALREPPQEHDAPLAALLLLPSGPAQHAERVIQAMFGLTPVEARIAKLLADGLTLNEAAEQMRMRPNTLRGYMKSIFVKLDLHRQSELVRLVSTTAGLLRGAAATRSVAGEAPGTLRATAAREAGSEPILVDDAARG